MENGFNGYATLEDLVKASVIRGEQNVIGFIIEVVQSFPFETLTAAHVLIALKTISDGHRARIESLVEADDVIVENDRLLEAPKTA